MIQKFTKLPEMTVYQTAWDDGLKPVIFRWEKPNFLIKEKKPYRNYTTLQYTRFRHISIVCLFSEYFGQYLELVKLQKRTKAVKQINFQMIYLMILRPSCSIKKYSEWRPQICQNLKLADGKHGFSRKVM